MTRIKSVWLKRGDHQPKDVDGHAIVCENGVWLVALFWFNEMHMRWERATV